MNFNRRKITYQVVAMSNNPLISVVIPCYNAEKYLAECLDSLLDQNVQDMQIICVNDGSTDATLNILHRYASNYNSFNIIDGPNGGYGKAMNKGLDAATGKYFALLEPDDVLEKGAYSKLLATAEKYQLDFVKGDVLLFREDVSGVKTWKRQYKRINNIVLTPRDYPKLLVDMFPATWAGVYNTEFLKKNGIHYIETPGASFQDMGFFFITSALAEKVMYIDDVVYRYRTMHETSSCANRGKMPYALRDVYLYVQEKLSRTPEIWEKIKPVYLARRVDGHSWIYNALPYSVRFDYLEETRKEFLEYETWDYTFLAAKRYYFEELLLSVENFLSCEALRRFFRVNNRNSVLFLTYKRNTIKVCLYSLLSKFCFGRLRKRIKEKKNRYKQYIKEVENMLKMRL